jgi:hypothetical protein
MDAARVAEDLEALARRRGLGDRVQIRHACAGGCAGPGPNVSVTKHAMPPAGAPPDEVAIGWKTYVASIHTLECLAQIIDENLDPRERAADDATSTGRSKTRLRPGRARTVPIGSTSGAVSRAGARRAPRRRGR